MKKVYKNIGIVGVILLLVIGGLYFSGVKFSIAGLSGLTIGSPEQCDANGNCYKEIEYSANCGEVNYFAQGIYSYWAGMTVYVADSRYGPTWYPQNTKWEILSVGDMSAAHNPVTFITPADISYQIQDSDINSGYFRLYEFYSSNAASYCNANPDATFYVKAALYHGNLPAAPPTEPPAPITIVQDPVVTPNETAGAQVNTTPAACVPDWHCTDWSACTDSMQDRSCLDYNKCGLTTGGPEGWSLTQSCSVISPITNAINDIVNPPESSTANTSPISETPDYTNYIIIAGLFILLIGAGLMVRKK